MFKKSSIFHDLLNHIAFLNPLVIQYNLHEHLQENKIPFSTKIIRTGMKSQMFSNEGCSMELKTSCRPVQAGFSHRCTF